MTIEANGAETLSPTRPRLVLRVGVTGHRSDDLAHFDADAIRTSVASILARLSATFDAVAARALGLGLYRHEQPVLRVVSRLADGADLIVAEEAIRQGIELQCILPFPRDVYDDEVAESWRESYRAALAAASPSAVLELDGDPQNRIESFFDGRRAVLRQSDVLIAIWDPELGAKGDSSGGVWGTRRAMAEARRDGLLAIHVHPGSPGDPHLDLCEGDEETCTEPFGNLEDQLRRILLPRGLEKDPKAENRNAEEAKRQQANSADAEQRKAKADANQPERPDKALDRAARRQIDDYFGERHVRYTVGDLWNYFRDLVAGKWRLPALRVQPFVAPVRESWARWNAESGLDPVVGDRLAAVLLEPFAWADRLATYYADLTRSSFLFNYLAAAFAVLFALVGYGLGWTSANHEMHHLEWVWIAVELVLIAAIVANTFFANRRRWHERWIDYRLLAEHLRVLRFLLPLGRVTPHTRLPAHVAYGDARGSWMYWYFRALIREAGVLGARFDANHVEAGRALLARLITDEAEGQIRYHERNDASSHAIHHRLHATGIVLFVLTGVACAVHLVVHSAWLTLAAAGLPAFGAALAGIASQAQLERLGRRSRSMAQELRRLDEELRSQPPMSRAVGPVAEEIASSMTAEFLDWRTLFAERRVELPA